MEQENNRKTDWLTVQDLREMFPMGDTKARKVMAALPSIRIGSTRYVLKSKLDAHINANGGININWH